MELCVGGELILHVCTFTLVSVQIEPPTPLLTCTSMHRRHHAQAHLASLERLDVADALRVSNVIVAYATHRADVPLPPTSLPPLT